MKAVAVKGVKEFEIKEIAEPISDGDKVIVDTILYAKYSGTDVKVDGTEYKILSIKDALAIIE